MANGNILPPSETVNRLSYPGPKIKSEIDELSTLGGMTRLVERRSPSSEASPGMKHSSPSTRSDSHVYLSPPESSMTSTAWQNYTHIQNFNVNINMSDGYYPHSNPTTPVPQVDVSMLYQIPNHVQQQKPGMQMEPMASDMYYNYQPSQYSGYMTNPQSHHMASGHEMAARQGPPMYDLNESWQNFMAPYKT